MSFVGFISPLICLFLITILLVNSTKKKFGDCLPLTLLILPIILLLSYYALHNLKIGIFIILFLALMSGIIFLISIKKETFRNNVFTTGFFTFIFIYFFTYIITRDSFFYAWDEFSHWGPMINELVENDNIYIKVWHASYPPLVQLFEYLLIKLGLAFEEYNLKFAVLLFDLSIFAVPFSEKLGNDNKAVNVPKGIVSFITIFIISAGIDSYNTFATIYLDVSVAMFFAYIIQLLIYEESNWIIAVAMFSFILVKDISLMFCLLVLLFILISFIQEVFNKQNKREIIKNYVIKYLYVMVPAIISYLLWHIHKVRAGLLNDQFSLSNYSFAKFLDIFLGKLSGDRMTAANAFFDAIFKNNLSKSGIPLTFFSSLLILGLVVIIFSYIFKAQKSQTIKIVVFLILSYTAYLLFMLNMYVNIFVGIESTELASYKRYMSTLVLSLFLIVFDYIYKYLKKNAVLVVFAIVSIVFSSRFIISSFNNRTNSFTDKLKYERNIYKQLTKNVKSDDKCLVVISKKYDSDLIKNYYNVNNVQIDLYNVNDVFDEYRIKSFYDNLSNYKYISVIDYSEIIFPRFYSIINKYIVDNSLQDYYKLSALQVNKIMPLK